MARSHHLSRSIVDHQLPITNHQLSTPPSVFRTPHSNAAFTLIEIMIAIGILALVLTAIYSTWTAILRSSKVGLEAAASVQRSRIALRVLEDSLGSAQSFALNQKYYGFVAANGEEATLSFVARLAKSFPRSGRFGDLDVRRLQFSIESGPDSSRQLVLRQNPFFWRQHLTEEWDEDEQNYPLVLAKNVREFKIECWPDRRNDWTEDWVQTNQLPKLVKITLKLADNPHSTQPQDEITRIISLPATTVAATWQMPRMPGQLGATNLPPGALPPGVQPGGTQPRLPGGAGGAGGKPGSFQ